MLHVRNLRPFGVKWPLRVLNKATEKAAMGRCCWLPDPWRTQGILSQPLWARTEKSCPGDRLPLAASLGCGLSGPCALAAGKFSLLTYWQGASYCLLWSSYKFLSCSCNLTVSDEIIQILAWEACAADECHALPGWWKITFAYVY